MRLFTNVERPSALPAALAQFAGAQVLSTAKPAASLRSDATGRTAEAVAHEPIVGRPAVRIASTDAVVATSEMAQSLVQVQYVQRWVTAQLGGVMGTEATGAAGKDIDRDKIVNGVVSGVPPRSRPV